MAIRPSTPEIITVNSEALQSQIRDLLPSQNGFGSELQASNVITPIIDLTATAEGSGLPVSMQQAIAFASNTAFEVTNATQVLMSSPGFWRVTGAAGIGTANGVTSKVTFTMTDGLATKNLWRQGVGGAGGDQNASCAFDLIFFLRAGDSVSAVSDQGGAILAGSYRQIATGDGTLVNPTGYPL